MEIQASRRGIATPSNLIGTSRQFKNQYVVKQKTGAIRLQFSRTFYNESYNDFLPAALAFAQRALAAAEILALAAALIPPFLLGAGLAGFAAGFAHLSFAQRSLAAALILALAAALIVNFFLGAKAPAVWAVEPSNWLNSLSKAAMSSLRLFSQDLITGDGANGFNADASILMNKGPGGRRFAPLRLWPLLPSPQIDVLEIHGSTTGDGVTEPTMARPAALSCGDSFDQVATIRVGSGPSWPRICARICV